jgi:S1-C subfamily serine protease
VKITKDPANDLAIIKIDAKGLTPIEMGDSDTIKVGQFAIAIGTALGEFRHTVTTGVISGLGRGITAGSAYEGFVERLDNVIQTDAAINPGNSGGPLLNSIGQAVAVNVAVAQGAQNIGFAIPINVVKKGLEQFNNNGAFASKPFLGVQYQMISKQSALMNEVPQGAYVAEVVPGSPAEKAGIKVDDIITELNGQKISDNKDGLAGVIATLKASDTVTVKIWRDGKVLEVTTTLSSPQQ